MSTSTPRDLAEPDGHAATSTNSALRAGSFSDWLVRTRQALASDTGVEVDCTGCDACCTSAQFVHIRPDETAALCAVPNDLLASAPGLPRGHRVLGYDARGHCPMLRDGRCSIYTDRPVTCRTYDCRMFAAAGIAPGGDRRARIADRVRRWRFEYPSARDRREHEAVQACARFIRDHAAHFPGGVIPSEPGQLAVLAIKAYGVFVGDDESADVPAPSHQSPTDADLADAIVHECRLFDAGRRAP